MKKKIFIITLFLISCGDSRKGGGSSGLSPCDCAKMQKEYIDHKIENLTKTSEEKNQIEAEWEEKLKPCTKSFKIKALEKSGENENMSEEERATKMEAIKKFEREKQECLMMLFQAENEKEIE